MNSKFDDLAKSLARSITFTLLGMMTSAQFVPAARASDLYVNANAAAGGDGTAVFPYRRITDAVGRARQLRQSAAIPTNEQIFVQIAPGNYVGTFNDNPLENSENKEVLPLILNVSNLALAGASVMNHDARGLPTGPANGPQTRLKASDLTDGAHQALIVIGRTTDRSAGDGVTVTGFTFGEKNADNNNGGLGIVVDRVADFAIHDNAFLHTGIGLIARLSSGTVDGNYFLGNSSVGPGLGGGSMNHPAQVSLSRNRSTGPRAERISAESPLCAHWIRAPIRLSWSHCSFPSIATTLRTRRTFRTDSMSSSATMILVATATQASGASPMQPIQPSGTRQRTPPSPRPLSSARRLWGTHSSTTGTMAYRLKQAELSALTPGTGDGNSRPPSCRILCKAMAAQGRCSLSLRWGVSLGYASVQDLKYLKNSTYDVTDFDGDLAGLDYDNPAADPFSGTVLNNSLTVNGTAVPPGTKITSLKK